MRNSAWIPVILALSLATFIAVVVFGVMLVRVAAQTSTQLSEYQGEITHIVEGLELSSYSETVFCPKRGRDVVVTTACESGEDPAACYARHLIAIAVVEADCVVPDEGPR